MKFKLPRQTSVQNIYSFVAKEVRKQDLYVICATPKHLKEMAKICQSIEKEGLPQYLVQKKLPSNLGYGIFLHPKAEPLLKGQMVAPYAGELSFYPQNAPDDSVYAFAPLNDIRFTQKDQKSFDPNRRYHPRRLYSLNVDAVSKGNFTRFINHSDTPNIVAELMRIPSNTLGLEPSPLEVVYFVKKTIRPGEQLLVCYEDEENSYWGPIGIKPFPLTPRTFQLDASLKIISKSKLTRTRQKAHIAAPLPVIRPK